MAWAEHLAECQSEAIRLIKSDGPMEAFRWFNDHFGLHDTGRDIEQKLGYLAGLYGHGLDLARSGDAAELERFIRGFRAGKDK